MTATNLDQIVSYLDQYLRIADLPDSGTAVNGLQVANTGTIGRVVAAVDISQAAINDIVTRRKHRVATGSTEAPPLVLVHHGLFWDGSYAVTGRRYRRLKALLDADIAVYGAHIPLDVHPEVGNNAVLARELELADPFPFGDYKGVLLGIGGDRAMPRADLAGWLERRLKTSVRLIPGGPETTRRIGVITGAAGSMILAARDAGCDTFVTGEGAHHTFFDAMEFGVNVLYAGHYATEQVGVEALARHLSERFGLPWEFVDHPTGM
ncbi:MAG TPA: Nif3-like dinuclear metal center hexameric protein [Gemmatimonadales bacterium]|nr:Nif3-like dinuclear metal center hexameric protein [Gemmatimonadales bacterium]